MRLSKEEFQTERGKIIREIEDERPKAERAKINGAASHQRQHFRKSDYGRDEAPDHRPLKARALSGAAWLQREIPPPDFILGEVFSTETRCLLFAPTGIGKTLIMIALGMAVAAGERFLHWPGTGKPRRMLFIDGEMSKRLLRDRLRDEATRRENRMPATFFALSHDDIAEFAPLNSPEGQRQIEHEIEELGGVDLIIFDNVMSLISGDQKDEEGWRQVMPWVRRLTGRKIAQVWVHHTGHDETRGYGTKTREWQMDTVIHLDEVKRPDTDVSFLLTFRKARERKPENRAAFADCKIALVKDQWTSDQATAGAKGKVSPLGKKFFDALVNATISSDAKKMFNCPTATIEEWRVECVKLGLLDKDKPKSASALFSKHKRETDCRQQGGLQRNDSLDAAELKVVWLAIRCSSDLRHT
jgi:hypothetical protein